MFPSDTGALNVALGATDVVVAQSESKKQTNIEAYNMVLKGNYFYSRQAKGDDTRAVELYQQALKLDLRYALACANL